MAKKLGWAAVLASLLLAIGVSVASAATVPGNLPAADQYTEALPSSKGPRAAAGGSDHAVPLPPAVEVRLGNQAGRDAHQLKVFATSSRLGAPRHDLSAPRRAAAPSVLSSVADGSGELPLLLVALAVIGSLVLGVVAHRRTRGGSRA